MSQNFSYQNYVTDEKFLSDYNSYQAKYAKQMRESDKVVINLIREAVSNLSGTGRRLRLLDVGCSTGNLLLHIKCIFPDLELSGGDLALSSLEQCRANSELSGIEFKVLDLLKLPAEICDIVIVNAVLYMMEDEQFEQSIRNLANCLSSGGQMIIFDFFHPFNQHLSIIEKSRSHQDGLRLVFRPMDMVTRILAEAGFSNPDYRPFVLPIDLPLKNDGELVTYTVAIDGGRRLPFRGALSQPRCHLVAKKV
jgi:SAM-dependent methyltransferase